jgi:hypothetical protein
MCWKLHKFGVSSIPDIYFAGTMGGITLWDRIRVTDVRQMMSDGESRLIVKLILEQESRKWK